MKNKLLKLLATCAIVVPLNLSATTIITLYGTIEEEYLAPWDIEPMDFTLELVDNGNIYQTQNDFLQYRGLQATLTVADFSKTDDNAGFTITEGGGTAGLDEIGFLAEFDGDNTLTSDMSFNTSFAFVNFDLLSTFNGGFFDESLTLVPDVDAYSVNYGESGYVNSDYFGGHVTSYSVQVVPLPPALWLFLSALGLAFGFMKKPTAINR